MFCRQCHTTGPDIEGGRFEEEQPGPGVQCQQGWLHHFWVAVAGQEEVGYIAASERYASSACPCHLAVSRTPLHRAVCSGSAYETVHDVE